MYLMNSTSSKFVLCVEKLNMSSRYCPKLVNVAESFKTINRSVHDASAETRKHVSFEQFLEHRRGEAKRSVVVHLQSDKLMNDLTAYCSQFGFMNNVYHYVTPKNHHCALLEFSSEKEVGQLRAKSSFSNKTAIPTKSNFLWFKKTLQAQNDSYSILNKIRLKFMKNTTEIPSEKFITDMLLSADSVTNQMEMLYTIQKMSDVEMKLKFVAAYQLEQSFASLFPDIKVIPFGSSVNGFGKRGCDLDLVMSLMDLKKPIDETERTFFLHKNETTGSTKHQAILSIIADNMQYLLPSITNVRRILNAKVPIIKYTHSMTGMECDLSACNLTAIYMTEMLYLYGELDPRVRPLIFTVKKWANALNITNSAAVGGWITNFPLVLMVIFFLQNKGILPSLKSLRNLAKKEDLRIVDDHVDCSFIRDVSKIPMKRTNNSSLEELLTEFFHFYSTFDFETYAISVREGKAQRKPKGCALFIVNPLETTLNASKNVDHHQLGRMCDMMKSSSERILQKVGKNKDWGLVKLFNPSASSNSTNSMKKLLNIKVKHIMEDEMQIEEQELNRNEFKGC